jgi:hypothetical protein
VVRSEPVVGSGPGPVSRAPLPVAALWSRSGTPEVVAAAVVAVLAAALAGAAAAGPQPLAAAVGVVQLALVAGWVASAGAPGWPLAGAIALGAGIAADVRLLEASGAGLAAAAPVAGIAMLPAVGVHLFRRDRTQATAGVATATSAVLLAVCPAALLALRAGRHGTAAAVALVIAGAVTVLVVRVVTPLAGDRQAIIPPVIGAGAGTAAAAGYLAASGHPVDPGWLVGLAGAAVGGYLTARTGRTGRLGPTVTSLLALSLIAPVGAAVARAVFGG